MKLLKRLIPVLLLVGIIFMAVACDKTPDTGDDGPGATDTYTVTFDNNYSGAPAATTVTVENNSRVAKPETDPTREGYDFTGWYIDKACLMEEKFLSNGMSNSPITNITADTTFYAGWTQHVEASPLASINANYQGGNIEIGAALNSAFVSVTATYEDNTSKIVTDFTVGEIDTSSVGVKTVTISYTENGITKTCEISVEVVDSTATAGAVTLYFKCTEAWTNVYIYTYEPTLNGDWAGEIMTAEADGWYSYTFDEDETPVKVIFNNGKEGGQQTANLTYDGTNNYYIFNAAIRAGAWGADNTVQAPTTAPTYRFYFKNTSEWESVYAYAWTGGTNYAGAWPGTAMTAVDGHDGWYYIDIAQDAENIIFNAGDGDDAHKTADLDLKELDANHLYYDGTGWTDGFGE